MARSNVIEFARGFQESFQRQQQLELQRQREKRFGRQLTANATFQQSQANTQRQQFEQTQQRLTKQAEASFGLAREKFEFEKLKFGELMRDEINLNPKLEFLGKASKEGVPTSIVEQIEPFIPDDVTTEEAPIFFEVAQKLPFFKQDFLFGKGTGFGGGFGRRAKAPNAPKELIAPKFRSFLQDTDFANRPFNEQAAILRSFEESLGVNIRDAEDKIINAVSRDEVEFDLQSPFFQKIIEEEGGKALQPVPAGGDLSDVTGLSDDELKRIIEGG